MRLVGRIDAEQDQYSFKRSQFKVINIKNAQNLSSNSNLEGEEDMKNITLRKDGRYMGNITLNKKRYFVYDKNKKKCYSKLVNLKRQLLSVEEKKQKAPAKNKNFYEFAKLWLEKFKKPEVSKRSIEVYQNCIKNHLSIITENFDNLNTIKLQNYLNNMGNTRTKEIAFQTIKQIFRKAYELEYIKTNPADFLVKGKIIRNERLNFDLEEQKKILEGLDNSRISKLILFYLLTGVRLSEAINFKLSDIKGEYVYIKGTKTKNAIRYIKISEKFKSMLLEFDNEQPFKTDASFIRKKFKSYCEKIGIQGTIHQMRHTFACNLYYLGVPDKQRQEYLGHSSTAITNDIYTHLDPNVKKKDILNLYKDLYPKF